MDAPTAPRESGPEGNTGGQSQPATGNFSPPSISLPKGGGAIRGLGEKFTSNPATGTGSATVPVPTSPSRAGFAPELSLSYDSGAGNGPFGFGWSISLPSITRKTERGVPQYRDSDNSDVFILSGAEDLVPFLNAAAAREIDTATAPGYEIERYRPRVEGVFARIERWTQTETREVHWRTITRENVASYYGVTEASRITDPTPRPDGVPPRIYSWLICESRDDLGNAIVYDYKAEDEVGVGLTETQEANRRTEQRTANRYLKRVRYGNTVSTLEPARWDENRWLFELVLDYGEHDRLAPAAADGRDWLARHDPFSSYRAGFEIRTYRLCQRFLMFHHFPDEPGVGNDCLVRSLDLVYRSSRGVEADLQRGHPRGTFLEAVTQIGYRRHAPQQYGRRSMPPVEFGYTEARVSERVDVVGAESLRNLPEGIDESAYLWVDLFGEGVHGVLTEQATAWLYTRNLSPAFDSPTRVEFAATQSVARRPNVGLKPAGARLLDLEGDGQPDLVLLSGRTAGFFATQDDEEWATFRPFQARLNVSFDDPNLRFIDLDGDGRTDVLVTEDRVFTFYSSRGEEGFEPARHVVKAADEDSGPTIVFADGTDAIYLADMSGDGLSDIVRIRNGEICYWPNLGYGRFGRRVVMRNSPRFDREDVFDQRRVRLADIDGSGTTDVIYLAADGARLYFNESGNSWADPVLLANTPSPSPLCTTAVIDLFGNGTTCLVWSSVLPGDADRHVRYVDLMGGVKPHLLTSVINNLGAETHISYASSAKFYVRDEIAGRPWISRLPFPVHVVERVEKRDRVSANRFVTRYAYHHGYFDGEEREFRGFGMVEQWDTEQYDALADPARPAPNIDAASHVPPAWTRTWFHTGVFKGRDRVSNYFAGLVPGADRGEYYREPSWANDDAEAARHLLDDTVLPDNLTLFDEREACRALRGAMLRQELYAQDGSPRAQHPYKVIEQNFSVQVLQPRAANRHGVFLVQPREALEHHYERSPDDPRLIHNATLRVDEYGNTLQSVAVSYGRRLADPAIDDAGDRAEQLRLHITAAEHRFTNPVDAANAWRTPLMSETKAFEVTGLPLAPGTLRFSFDALREAVTNAVEISYATQPSQGILQKRLLDQTRILYRRNNLAGPLLLHELQSRALPFEIYKLALTPGLAADAFEGRVDASTLEDAAGFVHSEGDNNWWAPSGRFFYSHARSDSPAQELAYAQAHFFMPVRYRDPFDRQGWNTETIVTYDRYDLLIEETADALGNRLTAGERDVDPSQPLVRRGNDYRVLQPALLMDANRNRSTVAFDALGLIVGTAVRGKPEENLGDSLDGFVPDLDEDVVQAHLADPLGDVNPAVDPAALLQRATTRMIYDSFAAMRTRANAVVDPVRVYTLARETHDEDLERNETTRIQHTFSYSDGFGRELQQVTQAEPGPVPERDPVTGRIVAINGHPRMTAASAPRRWAASGWRIYNNKGLAIRQFEPFFIDTHQFESDLRVGVGSLRCYDPLGRTVAIVHPNHSWDKVVFDAWTRETWDANDTAMIADPSTDPHVGSYFARLPAAWYQPVWSTPRLAGTLGPAERAAAEQTEVHRDTPTRVYLDSLGRAFLTVAHNRFFAPDAQPGDAPIEERLRTRAVLSIEGNQLSIVDARDRVATRNAYDMLGTRLRAATIDGGARWTLHDVANKPIRRWDSRGHVFRFVYDRLRRSTQHFVVGDDPQRSDPRVLNRETLVEVTEYGDTNPNASDHNLRTRIWRQLDAAGRLTNESYDFKGNLTSTTRELAQEYQRAVDWSLPVVLENDVHRATITYDALNRRLTLAYPDGSVIRHRFNEASLLEGVDVNLRGEVGPQGAQVWRAFVTNVDYDAKGQRTTITYGNGAETRYAYDLDTLRLTHLYTRRGAAFTADCENPAPPPPTIAAPAEAPDTPCGVQNLRYTYDPAGNITHIQDTAQHTIFFRNQRVDATNEFVYDAVYRLIQATGREHLGQNAAPVPHSYNDFERVGELHPGDGNAMGRYREYYEYDGVGNLTAMTHRELGGGGNRWSRSFTYSEPSAIDVTQNANRLTQTTIGVNATQPVPEPYGYDAHGNMTRMPQLQAMEWDYRDRLYASQRQAVNADDATGEERTGERTYYVYDASGQRVRKITELSVSTPANPVRRDERIYLAGFEIYQRYGVNALTRETLHVMDDTRRIAQVETRTDQSATPLVRYVFSNHIDSSCLELDDRGDIISYEEYTPYGNTAYRAVRQQVESPNRYRMTGNERDEETGFDYHGARYYIPWLGRWGSVDPLGIVSTPNTYAYAGQNPVRIVDPTGLADQPGFWEQTRRQAVVASMIGVRRGWAQVNPLALMSLSQVQQDEIQANTLLAQGDYDRAFAIASGFPDYVDIRDEGVANGATGGEQAAVMLGHATGFNQAVETTTGETRSGAELKGFDRFMRGVDATLRLVNTVLTVATGVEAVGAEARTGLPFSSERAMNKALIADRQAPIVLPAASLKGPALSDDALIGRAEQLFKEVVRAFFEAKGKPGPANIDVMRKQVTVAVMEAEIAGKRVQLVAVNNPAFFDALKKVAMTGEEAIEPIRAVRLSNITGAELKTGGIDVHAEQVLAVEFAKREGTIARVATSNKGCQGLCVPWLTEEYPQVTHVNPAKPKKTTP